MYIAIYDMSGDAVFDAYIIEMKRMLPSLCVKDHIAVFKAVKEKNLSIKKHAVVPKAVVSDKSLDQAIIILEAQGYHATEVDVSVDVIFCKDSDAQGIIRKAKIDYLVESLCHKDDKPMSIREALAGRYESHPDDDPDHRFDMPATRKTLESFTDPDLDDFLEIEDFDCKFMTCWKTPVGKNAKFIDGSTSSLD